VLGTPELLIVLAIVLLLFGSRRIPELGKGLGQGIRSFKDGLSGKHADEDAKKEVAPPAEGEAEKKLLP